MIGVPRYDGQKVRERVKSVRPEHLYIAATHTHSGPDTLGQWGPSLTTSGVDKEWKASMLDKIVALVEQTSAKLEPAAMRLANTTDVPKISKNSRVPQILDTELGVMQFLRASDKKPLATFVNFAVHPEVLETTHELSSDMIHWLYETVEQSLGGVCLYLNGAQGGMVTADFDESEEPRGKNWKAAEKLGRSLGERVLTLIEKAEVRAEAPTITTQQRIFEVPMESQEFWALIKLKVFPSDVLKGNNVVTEVNRITIGDAELLTLPGEVLPNIGFFLKRQMSGKHKFLLGLTCDELGYILSESDFGLKLYAYESRVSVGSQMGPRMIENLRALLPPKKPASATAQK